jgi:hypothetical protein
MEVRRVEVYRKLVPLSRDNPAEGKGELSRHLKKFKGDKWRSLDAGELKELLFKKKVFLRDPVDLKKDSSSAYIYAVRVVDGRGKKSAFSKPVSLIPRLVSSPPADLSYELEEKKINLTLYPPRSNMDGSEPPILSGLNIYRREGGKDLYVSASNTKPLPYIPDGWEVNGVVSLSAGEEGGTKVLSFLPDPEATAVVTREIDLSLLEGVTSGKLSVSFSARVIDEEKVPGSASFKASPPPEKPSPEEKIELSSSFSPVNLKWELYEGLLQLRVKITPSSYRKGVHFEIADFTVSYITPEGEKKDVLSDEFVFPDKIEFEDRSFEFGKTYYYMARSVYSAGGAIYESPDSKELKVLAKDTFPPPTPQGLVAITGDGTVHLSWQEVEAVDLSGYNIYRREWRKGTEFIRLNEEPITELVFHDSEVIPGKTYIYFLKAIDKAKPANESERSKSVMLKVE